MAYLGGDCRGCFVGFGNGVTKIDPRSTQGPSQLLAYGATFVIDQRVFNSLRVCFQHIYRTYTVRDVIVILIIIC